MIEKKLKYPEDWKVLAKDQKISLITAYDATMARICADSMIDAILVGDSLGNVVQGKKSTIPVTLDEMTYHCQMVRRGAPSAFIIGDLPFGSYQSSEESAIASAIALYKNSDVDAVKLEGAGQLLQSVIPKIVEAGIPVMGHIGLTPQSYRNLGGFKVQREKDHLLEQAKQLEKAGCFSIVLELIQDDLAKDITDSLKIPTIGIGSGKHTSGQVLVINDMLGLNPDFTPKHTRKYMNSYKNFLDCLNQYVNDVNTSNFPGTENSFK